MAATDSIKITKQFPYRGGLKSFSNRYHFNGGTPVDNTHWTTLSDAIVAAEKAIYMPIGSAAGAYANIVSATGYAAGSDVPVFSKAYAQAGTGNFTTYNPNVGAAAALVRYSTTQRTSKNHPIYLFNYYHAAVGKAEPNQDQLHATQSSAMATYGAAWVSGFSDGTVTHHRAGPNGAVAQGVFVETFLTHRDFPG